MPDQFPSGDQAVLLHVELLGLEALSHDLLREKGPEETANELVSLIGTLADKLADLGGRLLEFDGRVLLSQWDTSWDEGSNGGCVLEPATAVERAADFAESTAEVLARYARETTHSIKALSVITVGHWSASLSDRLAVMRVASVTPPGRVALAGLDGELPKTAGEAGPAEESLLLGCQEGVTARLLVRSASRRRADQGGAGAQVECETRAALRPVSVLYVRAREEGAIEAASKQIEAFGGCLYRLEFVEDEVSALAVFGLPPNSPEDDACHAVETAISIAGSESRADRTACGIATGLAFWGEVRGQQWRFPLLVCELLEQARILAAADRPRAIACDETTYRSARRRVEFALAQAQAGSSSRVYFPQGLIERRSRPRGETVGRDEERGELRTALRNLKEQSQGGLWFLTGQPGIGKSKLTAEARGMANGLGVACYSGSASQVEQATTYHAWRPVLVEALRLPGLHTAQQVVAAARALLPSDSPLLDLLPLLAAVLPCNLPDNDITSLFDERLRALNTQRLLAGLLKAASHCGPVVIVLDDVQWMDSASWVLASEVQLQLTQALLLLAGRPVDSAWASEGRVMVSAKSARRLDLAGLSSAAAIELAGLRLGAKRLAPDVADCIVARCDGNPFYCEEIAFALRDSGLVRVEGGECQLALESGNLADLKLPHTLQGVITSRIDRLGPIEQLVLKVCSVVGRPASVGLLECVLGQLDRAPGAGDPTSSSLEDHFQALALAELIVVEPAKSGARFALKHEVTKEVSYELLVPSLRAAIHHAVANWYEGASSEDPVAIYPQLAHHFACAHQVGKAIEYSQKAGTFALSQFAIPEAKHFVTVALDLARQQPDQVDRGQEGLLEFLAGEVARFENRFEDATTCFGRARGHADAAGDGKTGLEATCCEAVAWQCLRQYPKALLALEAASQRAEQLRDAENLLRTEVIRARVHWLKTDVTAALAAVHRALELAQSLPPSRQTNIALSLKGMVLILADVPGLTPAQRLDAGIKVLEDTLAAARKLQDRVAMVNALNLIGNAQLLQGQFEQAYCTFVENLDAARDINAVNDQICEVLNLGIAATALGRFQTAFDHFSQALTQAGAAGQRDWSYFALTGRAAVGARLGKLAGATADLEAAQEMLLAVDDSSRAGLVIAAAPQLVECHLGLGQTAVAWRLAQEAVKLMEQSGSRETLAQVSELEAECQLRAGSPAAARQTAETALELAHEVNNRYLEARCLAVQAELALGEEDGTGQRLAQEAFGMAQDLKAEYLQGELCLLLARSARDFGDGRGAASWLQQAQDLAIKVQAPELEARVLFMMAEGASGADRLVFRERARDLLADQLAGLAESNRDGYLSVLDRRKIWETGWA